MVLPSLNVEKEIYKVVSETLKYSDTVIVVSDGSTDRTAEIAKKAGAYIPPVQLKIKGKGNAIRRGIEISKNFDSDIIVLMDSDGQHLPNEIPDLITPIINENYDMVIGSRMKGKLRTSIINKFGNVLLKILSFLITFKWFTDTESGFRAYKSKLLQSLPLETERYEIESELLIKSLYRKFRYKEVPITVPKAVPGATMMDGIRNAIYKIKLGIKRKK
ncbi:MAG: glycosyltransferase family 2 protein [Promethearchaeota archaeon]